VTTNSCFSRSRFGSIVTTGISRDMKSKKFCFVLFGPVGSRVCGATVEFLVEEQNRNSKLSHERGEIDHIPMNDINIIATAHKIKRLFRNEALDSDLMSRSNTDRVIPRLQSDLTLLDQTRVQVNGKICTNNTIARKLWLVPVGFVTTVRDKNNIVPHSHCSDPAKLPKMQQFMSRKVPKVRRTSIKHPLWQSSLQHQQEPRPSLSSHAPWSLPG
jgi:hypothetical protein